MMKYPTMRTQQGAILVVSLLILLVITLLGTAAMQSTSLEMKMARNVEERQRVFQGAEATLRRVELDLQANPYSRTQLGSGNCAVSGNLAGCFESTCAGGLCFFGDSTAPDDVDCEVYAGTPPTYPIWDSNHPLDVWNNAAKYKTLADIDTTSFKYIVEFQCYVDSRRGPLVDSLGAVTTDGDALFRITVLATNANGNINVMLQSTYGVEPN